MDEVQTAAAPIIIVDDSREDLLLMERLLRQCKLLNPIVPLQNGDECITYFQAVVAQESIVPPILVLLDLIMAPASGLDVLRELQKWQVMDRTPVVMLSGIRDIHVATATNSARTHSSSSQSLPRILSNC